MNPGIVLVSLSGFGQTGPYRDLASHGVGFDAYAALAPPVPGPNGWPCIPGGYTEVGITAGPLYGTVALLAGILSARATGEGCTVDVAEADAAAHWNAWQLSRQAAADARAAAGEVTELAPPPGLRPGQDPFQEDVRYQYYRTADGRHVLFMASERKFWEHFTSAVGRPDLLDRFPSAEVADHQFGNRELRAELVEVFATRTQADWVQLFLDADVAGVPVNADGAELRSDPHFRARMRWLDASVHGMPILGTPIHTEPALPDPPAAPEPGEHTEVVLRDVLGYGGERLAALRASGALGPAP
ncbi:MAG: CoA transferase [Acidimicrobiia bacterium]|nr:CoA transferase [Acidimicrobiia bacterium]